MYSHDVLRPLFGAPSFASPIYGMNQPFGFTAPAPAYGYGQGFSHAFPSQQVFPSQLGQYGQYGWNAGGTDIGAVHHRIEALTGQIAQLTELVCRTQLQGAQLPGAHHYAPNTIGFTSGRVRESDSHLFWEVAFPGLSMGDLDIEVSGNRVICRTRVPLRAQLRAVNAAELPRGLEIFELPDGRVELNWLVPVSFNGKEVEACWKDGWVQISIPKTEVTHRQAVKINADATGPVRKNGARDMTA